MELARELMRTCWAMYATTESGLSPEIAWFETDPGDLGIVVAKIQSLGKKTSSSSLLMHTICSVRKPWRVSSWCFVFPTTLSIGSGDGRCLRHSRNTRSLLMGRDTRVWMILKFRPRSVIT
jgi:hypothetical protein